MHYSNTNRCSLPGVKHSLSTVRVSAATPTVKKVFSIEVLSAHPAIDGVLGLQQRRDALVLRALVGLACWVAFRVGTELRST